METLTCRACADFLADYLSGELDAEVRASFEVHLDRCRNCRTYLEQYAAVIAAGQRACHRENEAAARAMPEELVRAILEAESGRGKREKGEG
jgi:anti-sigma factor RsiW